MQTIGSLELWIGFIILVAVVFSIDFFLVKTKKAHRVSTKEALSWVMIWFFCAMLFNVALWWHLSGTLGPEIAQQKSLEFLTGYIIEESLSVDNMFAFIMIFHYFAVPPEYQRRVLVYGVLSAIILRLLMILFGTWLVYQLHWILYVFGAFLIFTGVKMLLISRDEKTLGQNPVLIWLRNHLRITHEFHQEHFFIRRNLLWYATPLFLVLVLIEISDLIFALDSIPAILAITTDPFIVFTSNIFAILGLRALYFLLVNLSARFHLLKFGVAIILVFIGIKMVIEPWVSIPIILALSIVISILGTTALLSWFNRRREKRYDNRK